MWNKMMMCLLTALISVLFVYAESSSSSSCNINQCQCVQRPGVAYEEVKCFIKSITPSDATIKSLPPDIQALTLTCNSPNSSSFLYPGIFQPFNNLQTLSVETCTIRVLTSESFLGLESLRNLSFMSSVMPPVSDGMFIHLSNLRSLTLVYCNLETWPDISHFNSLQFLNISHNNISSLWSPEHTTTSNSLYPNSSMSVPTDGKGDNQTSSWSLPNLVTLDLSYNRIISSPVTLISRRAPQLQHLYLTNLMLTQIIFPEVLELKNLLVLDARDNLLEKVDLLSLSRSSPAMRELLLEGVGHPVDTTDLSNLNKLEKLVLKNFSVSDEIWPELNSTFLWELHLDNNKLTSIDVTGHYLPNLKVLGLTSNMISEVTNLTFMTQPNLQLLNMSGNNIRSLPANLFQNNSQPRVLDFAHNQISEFHAESLSNLHELQLLDLSHNLIRFFPDKIFLDMTSLLYLYLQHNQLQRLPELSHMSALLILDISNNQLSTLMTSDLQGLHKLESLYVSYNNIALLPPLLFSPCPNLLMARFDNNQITNMGTLDAHPNLAILRLDNNQLVDFIAESPFRRLKNLKLLLLDSNNLTTIPGNMFPSSLETLFINENNIRQFYSTSFKNLPHLKLVSITKNRNVLPLPLFSVAVFKQHSPKPIFNVENNIFLCDCNFSYLKVLSGPGSELPIFQLYYPRFVGLEHTDCYLPYESVSVQAFASVDLSQFVCPYSDTFCDTACNCCYQTGSCQCVLTCPNNCQCYYAGSAFIKIYIIILCQLKALTQVPTLIPQKTTVLLLDGNKISHVKQQQFAHLSNAEFIYLNNSDIQTIDDGSFETTYALIILFINDNLLTRITENLFGKLDHLKGIYLHNNLINSISAQAFSSLSSIQTITLHNNRLMILDAIPNIQQSLMSLTLSGNPWSCECNVSKVILQTILELRNTIEDREQMCCYVHNKSFMGPLDPHTPTVPAWSQGTESTPSIQSKRGNHDSPCYPLMEYKYETHCLVQVPDLSFVKSGSSNLSPDLIAVTVIIITLALLAVLVVFVLLKRREIQACMFVKFGIRILDKKEQLDKDETGQKMFDAFISYSSKDDEFVANTLVPALENEDRKYRVCVHYRDFPVGQHISDTICRAIENSSRTILLLTQNFLDSEWCRFEFQTAHHHIIRESSQRLIVVIFEDLDEEKLDPDLKVHLKSRTYLKYTDPWFWEKLFFALPSIKNRRDELPGPDGMFGMRFLAGDDDGGRNNQGNMDKDIKGHESDI